MEARQPDGKDNRPCAACAPVRNCDKCGSVLPHHIFHTVFINDGKEVCGTCMDTIMANNINRDI